jgi:hypothetical protein
MRFLLIVPMLLLLSCLSPAGQDQTALDPPDSATLETQDPAKIDVGRGVICETRQQVERFASLRGDGEEAAVALQTVNHEANNTDACSVTLVIFTENKAVGGMDVGGRPASILEITIQAFGNGRMWKQVRPIVQYTVAMEKGRIS